LRELKAFYDEGKRCFAALYMEDGDYVLNDGCPLAVFFDEQEGLENALKWLKEK